MVTIARTDQVTTRLFAVRAAFCCITSFSSLSATIMYEPLEDLGVVHCWMTSDEREVGGGAVDNRC
jgi:hypothetical protein